MTREKLEKFIADYFGAAAEYPWSDAPNFAVFRHAENKKWFALFMDVKKNKLGLTGESLLDVVNLKCDPMMIGTLQGERGIFPAYHMNKTHWITVALDGSAAEDMIKMLVSMSFDFTALKTSSRTAPKTAPQNLQK